MMEAGYTEGNKYNLPKSDIVMEASFSPTIMIFVQRSPGTSTPLCVWGWQANFVVNQSGLIQKRDTAPIM